MFFGFTTSRAGRPATTAQRHTSGDPRQTALLLAGFVLVTAAVIIALLAT